VVVGGGVLGTMHAWYAVEHGFEVTQIEKDPVPEGASVRNFGLIWVSGRADGAELDAALYSRAAWKRIGERVPDIGFRACGSITVAFDEAEVSVLKTVANLPSTEARGLEFLDPVQVRLSNPAIRGEVVAGLFCATDAVVEPSRLLGGLRASMEETGRYRFVPGRMAINVGGGALTDQMGETWVGDLLIFCPGADHSGVAASHLESAPLRRVFLHMMETAPLGFDMPTAVADADTFRYYPPFRAIARQLLPPQGEEEARYTMQLLMVQRADGGLTIGDTHLYDEPFDFAIEERPYQMLADKAIRVLGFPLPDIRRRWSGVYSQTVSDDLYFRRQVDGRTVVITGPGGRGNTLAPAIAGQTFEGLGL